MPSPEDVAETIAQKERIRIRPSGMYALNKLGISTQVPTQLIYITNGQRRKISIGNTEVNFRSTTAKKMALKGPLSSLVIKALGELGTENISEDVKAKVKDCLLKNDLSLAPARIHDFILKLLNTKMTDWLSLTDDQRRTKEFGIMKRIIGDPAGQN